MRKTIYAVNTGSYSDYRVVALFSTREKADEYMAMVPDVDYNAVEEYELDSVTPDLIKRGYAPWSVTMLRDGTTESATRCEVDAYSVTRKSWMWRRTQAPAYKGTGKPDALCWHGMAKSKAQAVKSANELRAQWIADGTWESPDAP